MKSILNDDQMVYATSDLPTCDSDEFADEEQALLETDARVRSIIASAKAAGLTQDQENSIKAIEELLDGGEMNRRKFLNDCLDYFEDIDCLPKAQDGGLSIAKHDYLSVDKVAELNKIIKEYKDEKNFGLTVSDLLGKKGMKPSMVYKEAMISRQAFNKAIDSRTESVSRLLVWQIIVGLHCNEDEMKRVLRSAGYNYRASSKFDLVLLYFITTENYDIMAINEQLELHKCKVFSCYKTVKDNEVF